MVFLSETRQFEAEMKVRIEITGFHNIFDVTIQRGWLVPSLERPCGGRRSLFFLESHQSYNSYAGGECGGSGNRVLRASKRA